MPLVQDTATIVRGQGIIREQHHIPVLVIWEPIIVGEEHELAWLSIIIARHGCLGPDLSAVDSNHTEESRVVDLAVLDFEGRLLALVTVIQRIEATDNIPMAIDLIIFNFFNGVGGVPASSIVQRIRRWQAQALMVHIEALHHVVNDGSLVAFRALQCACRVHLGALTSTIHILSAGLISDTARDLAHAVASDASGVLNWQGTDIVLINQSFEVFCDNFSAIFVLLGSINGAIDGVINILAVLVQVINSVIQKVIKILNPLPLSV